MTHPFVIRHEFAVATGGPGLVEFTAAVAGWLAAGAPGATGLLTLFLRHSSASLLVQENADPSARADLETFLARLVPSADDPGMRWVTHRQEGSDDMPAHCRAALLPVSLSIPVISGKMQLGTWQGIYVFEHRRQPHRRRVAAMLLAAPD